MKNLALITVFVTIVTGLFTTYAYAVPSDDGYKTLYENECVSISSNGDCMRIWAKGKEKSEVRMDVEIENHKFRTFNTGMQIDMYPIEYGKNNLTVVLTDTSTNKIYHVTWIRFSKNPEIKFEQALANLIDYKLVYNETSRIGGLIVLPFL